jgi:hypothetical protein
MKIKLLLIVFFVGLQFSNAQQRTCGVEARMEALMADPIQKAQFLDRQAKFEIEYQKIMNEQANSNRVASPQVTMKIPVAVHFPEVPNTSSETLKNCLRNLAQSQVNVINSDYNATNSDISNWAAASAFYPGVNVGSLDVQFEIATQNHPAGTGLSNGTVAVTFGTDFLNGADSDFTWSGYMNFVVRDEGNFILGYSPLAGSPASGHTVVMNTFCFGTGTGCSGYQPSSPFNLGRTVTHELGHFFNLDHTFASTSCSGGSSNCAIEGDGVCDTPRIINESYNCPTPGSVPACSPTEKSLTMNYMDYVDDPCMYMFTAGQKNRMQAYLNVIASQFNQNVLANDDLIKNNFSISPNPNKGSFELQLIDNVANYSIQIFDTSGRVVFENEYIQNTSLSQTITLDAASSGIYFVSIKSKDAIITKKIIVE